MGRRQVAAMLQGLGSAVRHQPCLMSAPSSLLRWACACGSSPATSGTSWAPHRGLHSHVAQAGQPEPAARQHELKVSIKAFERRYVDSASMVIRDLAFITLGPKISTGGDAAAPSNLSMPILHTMVPLDWRKSRFTVIRGPHIDKGGMEQFETRKYKAVLHVSTPSLHEVEGFLDSLKLYEFPGVQVQVVLTTSSFLTPAQLHPPTSDADQTVALTTGSGSLFAAHRQQIGRYLLPQAASPSPSSPTRSAASGSIGSHPGGQGPAGEDQLRDLLQMLRKVMYEGLKDQRTQLSQKASPAYAEWHRSNKQSTPHLYAAPPLADSASSLGQGVDLLMSHNRPSLRDDTTGPGSSRPSESAQQASAFLAAVDAVLLSLRFDALESHRQHPFRMASYKIGDEVPAAEWMQAVLRAGSAASALQSCSQEVELLAAYSRHTLFAHALLGALFNMWLQATATEMRSHLALPGTAQLAAMAQQSLKRSQS